MSEARRGGEAIIAGGSIGGLFAALVLMQRGWQVRVLEKVGMELAGRGAGIVTHAPLIKALQSVGASVENLGIQIKDRVAYDISGAEVRRMAYPQVVTSWDRIHQVLRELIPDHKYLTGHAVTGYQDGSGKVVVRCADGTSLNADLLVGADGFRSAIRNQMLPEVQPEYSGYVVWRAVADESSLPQDVHDKIFSKFGFFAPNGTQIVGYPIAGPDNDLRPGYRRYNFVWYSAVPEPELTEMLTDTDGVYHQVSIPPPLVRDEVLAKMDADAARRLPPPFVEMLRQSGRPFFTPIYDHCSPIFARGRVALSGDAACVARPHVGMGVTKAAEDALSLARHLSNAGVAEALHGYSGERVPLSRRARDRARLLGSYIFDGDPKQNLDGSAHPKIASIMRDTAVPV